MIPKLRWVLPTLLATALLLEAAWAMAFKPVTHVALAEIALRDALDDGRVSIYRVDNGSHVGDFAVDPALLSALRSHRAQYIAGVLGPDAQPDILTGQQMIHPNSAPRRTSGPCRNTRGATAWMCHLWRSATRNGRPAVRAYAAGYLTHAAGDMYMHTFVNHFAGGPFKLVRNALRHFTLEGYVAKKGPMPSSYRASISGVKNWIYHNMIKGAPGSTVRGLTAGREGHDKSIPVIFSELRNRLQRDVAAGSAISPVVIYKRRWIRKIDRGLRAWPQVSHRIAVALMFRPGGRADFAAAQRVATEYGRSHLLGMAGGDVGTVAGLALSAQSLINGVLTALPAAISTAIRQVQHDLLDYILRRTFGRSLADLRNYLTSPERYLNQVMRTEGGRPITIRQINRDHLRLGGRSRWRYTKFPAAYNTVVMSKLILLSRSEINRLLRALGERRTMSQPNVMLGYQWSLDHSYQWRNCWKEAPNRPCSRKPAGPFGTGNAYNRMFLKIFPSDPDGTPSPGRVRTPTVTTVSAGANASVAPSPSTGLREQEQIVRRFGRQAWQLVRRHGPDALRALQRVGRQAVGVYEDCRRHYVGQGSETVLECVRRRVREGAQRAAAGASRGGFDARRYASCLINACSRHRDQCAGGAGRDLDRDGLQCDRRYGYTRAADLVRDRFRACVRRCCSASRDQCRSGHGAAFSPCVRRCPHAARRVSSRGRGA